MKKLLLLFFVIACSVSLFSQTIAKNEDGSFTVTGNNYTVKTSVYNGGYLGSIVVDNEEFLDQTVEITRSSYFYRNGAVKVTSAKQEDNKIICETEVGSVVYTFEADRFSVSAIGAEIPVNYYFVLDNRLNGLKIGDTVHKAPMGSDAKEAILIKRGSGIKVSGDMTFWGPWTNNTQIIDMAFIDSPGTKTVTFEPVKVSEEDIAVLSPGRNEYKQDLIIYNPKNYQVFQRETKDKGYIKFDGKANKKVSKISYSIEGKDYKGKKVSTGWKNIKCDSVGAFSVKAECPAGGWYKVQIKYVSAEKEEIKVIENVGVGEVIIGAGQSNSTNFGPDKTQTQTKMVSATDGLEWSLCDDPMPGVHDMTQGGSFFPTLGDALYNEFKVPIGIASTGFGGTSTFQWQPDADPIGRTNLFEWFMIRVLEFGYKGFRCVVWHQGESDFGINTKEGYFDNMTNIISQSRKMAGWYIPWFTAKASCWQKDVNNEETRGGQQLLWDTGVSFEGPDTDPLQGEDIREAEGKGVHFAKKGLEIHGSM
ncbi:MAG: hypothetical protein KBT47_04260, partial [Armatimonadetes bacterium]|nr:hypothetical protein [Candidatus Hippobium faecium]